MEFYYRPLLSDDPVRPDAALPIAGGWTWATHAERISRSGGRTVVPIREIPDDLRDRLMSPRQEFGGIAMDGPRLLGILNVTPDSFSDGGRHLAPDAAVIRATEMIAEGADLIDIGGESTRPGAKEVPVDVEIERIRPIVRAVSDQMPVSIDTRKAGVAEAAIAEGATIVNDVSGLGYDPRMAAVVAASGTQVILMHSRGTPETMQSMTAYEDVLLDVYDALEERIAVAEAAGIPRACIAVDPGIGFAKTRAQNLALLSGISLFHGLGCPIVLGVSRKKFVGELAGADKPEDRVAGSVGAALAAVAQGVQILRVHDTLATKQAMALWRASRGQ